MEYQTPFRCMAAHRLGGFWAFWLDELSSVLLMDEESLMDGKCLEALLDVYELVSLMG